ncbi:MAG TPA: extracellular solute-binding protein [Herpetosiphonaceae bacterium]|nr:extracellular solute-binding protein [Herpetosiphonaceae bacterium]
MKRTFRLASLVTLILLLGALLAACGGSGTTGGGAGAGATTAGGGAATGATTAAGGGAATGATTAAGGGTTGGAAGGTVSVLSLWGGSEQAAFQKVLDGFTTATGIQTQYEQARDFLPVLNTRIAAGNPPAVAIIPRPGIASDFAKAGSIKPITDLGITETDISQAYSEAWMALGTVDGTVYALPFKANSKSTVWYKPDSLQELGAEVPTDWDGLIALSDQYVGAGKKPWSIAGKDGWTLTDWFENIYVRTAGPEKYDQLFGGTLPFTDPSVVQALEQMATIVANEEYVAGGREGALGTAFVDGIGRVYGQNADAELYFEGGFVGGIAMKDVNTSLTPGETIDFFPFPTIGSSGNVLVGGGDLIVAFQDTPQVREFLRYLISQEAGETWISSGSIVSPNKQVSPESYPDELSQKEAEQVLGAEVFRFDGSDIMPGTLADEWGTALQGVLEAPDDIENILLDFEDRAAAEFGR